MATIINAQHLGDDATPEQAERMAELLRQRGYKVEVGPTGPEVSTSDIADEDWSACLAQVVSESD